MPDDPSAAFEVRLRRMFPDVEVVCEGETLADHGHDWWPLEMMLRRHGVLRTAEGPSCVVFPTSTKQVQAVMSSADEIGCHVVPYGGGSGVCGGARPTPRSMVIDLKKMNHVLEINETDLLVRVEAGALLHQLESELNAHGYSMRHFPQSIELASIGGMIATRSSGQFSTRYGSIEDMVAGCEVVRADGSLLSLEGIPRWASGPDMRHVFIGSEGTLGVITQATLKIHVLPAERRVDSFSFARFKDGLEAIRLIMRSGWKPPVLRLYDATETAESFHSYAPHGSCILLGATEGDRGMVEQEAAIIRSCSRLQGGESAGEGPAVAWLEDRNKREKFEKAFDSGVIIDTIEVGVRWSNAAELYENIRRGVRQVPCVFSVGAHSSHSYPQGTNFYFTVRARPPSLDLARPIYDSIWKMIMGITLEMGGTICHHHGVGKIRTPWIKEALGESYHVLEAMKVSLDPHLILNPGTLFFARDKKTPDPGPTGAVDSADTAASDCMEKLGRHLREKEWI